MSLLAKLYTWTEGGLIVASEWTNEFQQLIDILNGTSTAKRAYIQFSDPSLPVLRISQTGAGPIVEFQQAGATKVSINNTGQLVSAVATGNAPFVVSSTTKVTNLHCDKLDDLEGSQFVRNDTAGQSVISSFTIVKNSLGAQDLLITVDNNRLDFKRSSDSAVIFSVQNLNSATRLLDLPSTLNVQSAYTPAAANDVVRKTDADNYRIKTFSTYIAAPAATTRYGGFICPAAGTITSVKYAFYVAAGSNSTFQIRKNDTSQASTTVNSTDVTNTTYTNDITDFTVAANDLVQFYWDTDGGHNEVVLTAVMTV